MRDKLVLDNKKFLARPYLTHDDLVVTEFRHWYNQFYDQTSQWISDFKDPWIIDDDGKVRDEDGNVLEDFTKEDEDEGITIDADGNSVSFNEQNAEN